MSQENLSMEKNAYFQDFFSEDFKNIEYQHIVHYVNLIILIVIFVCSTIQSNSSFFQKQLNFCSFQQYNYILYINLFPTFGIRV
jgi:hypothetical protein